MSLIKCHILFSALSSVCLEAGLVVWAVDFCRRVFCLAGEIWKASRTQLADLMKIANCLCCLVANGIGCWRILELSVLVLTDK